MKKFCILTLALIISVSSVFAFGKKHTDDLKVEGSAIDGWNEEFSLKGKRPGKYNIVVNVRDIGGNITVGGPYNIFIDADSDLPVTGIINPLEGMNVQGNLNIVGTCYDDDAVDRVEIILDGDKENPVIAEGKEFWSYYLDTSEMEEGDHKIEVYAWDKKAPDENGEAEEAVKGKSVVINWKLNRRLPVSDISSHKMGTLVSGKQTITGEVSDGNGIKSLSYSVGNADVFQEIKLKKDKATKKCSFAFDLDTTKISDGAQVCWIKAKDELGGTGLYSFLFFVDNTDPEVSIIYPKADDIVNGRFSIAGIARDIVGLKSLKWKCADESGAIPVVRGNPYWCVDVDTRGKNASTVLFEIEAEDSIGNIARLSQKIAVNQDRDKPNISITEPVEGENYSNKVFLDGFAYDDDGIAEVHYKVDNGAEVVIPSKGTFFSSIENDIKMELKNGEHVLKAWAVDIDGISGDEASVKFHVTTETPSINIVSVAGSPYIPGQKIDPESGAMIKLSINPGPGIKKYVYQFSGIQPVEEKLDGKQKAPFTVDIPFTECGYGVTDLYFYVEDTLERKIETDLQFYVENLTVPRGNLETMKADVFDALPDGSSIYITDVGGKVYERGMKVIVPMGKDSEEEKFVTLNIESFEPLTAVSYSFNENAPKKIDFSQKPDSGVYSVRIPLKDAKPEYTAITVKAERGKQVPLNCTGVIAIARSKNSALIKDQKTLYWSNANYSQDGYYNIDQNNPMKGLANFQPPLSCEFVNDIPGLQLSVENDVVMVSAEKEGIYKNVRIRVVDADLREYISTPITVRADFGGPEIELMSPSDENLWIKDSLTVSGLCSDIHGISNVYYTFDGGASLFTLNLDRAHNIEGKIPFEQKIDTSMLQDGLVVFEIWAQDTLGKITKVQKIIQKDTTPPEIHVVLPEAGVTVNGETTIVFYIRDNVQVKAGYYVKPNGERVSLDVRPLMSFTVGTEEAPLGENMVFEFEDYSGNIARLDSWDFVIDLNGDKPQAFIYVPSEREVITTDFVISGIVLDDDGDSEIYFRIDNQPYQKVSEELSSNFSIPMYLSDFTDNEHTVTVYAVDQFGVKGDEFSRRFRVSIEEPKGYFVSPTIDQTVNGIIKITGRATDRNGIEKVQISLDNGNTFNDVVGQEFWEYDLDTRIYQDGTHVLFIKVWDNYGINGIYSTLINIDNTAPNIVLDLPVDGSKSSGQLFFSGHTNDNIGINSLTLSISSLDMKQVQVPPKLAHINLEPDAIVSKVIDISELSDGIYNVELCGVDAGGNTTRVSRNIELDKSVSASTVDILYPLNGEHVQGLFNLYGKINADKMRVQEADKIYAMLIIDDVQASDAIELPPTGFFKFELTPADLSAGRHRVLVRAMVAGQIVSSVEHYIIYTPWGPWVTIDNFNMGDFATDRPYIEGSAGYAMRESELMKLKNKKISSMEKKEIKEKTVECIEVSFDNGKTFQQVSETKKWRCRIENDDLAAGYHFMVVRAKMKNGEIAVTRTIIQIDKTPPYVLVVSPDEGQKFNDSIKFSGLASDNNVLDEITLSLRSGDKSSYEIPSFIQGLYFDWHFWGATLYDLGIGATFFNDIVKLQVQFGQYTQTQYNMMEKVFKNGNLTYQRYGGNIWGIKMLANIGDLPFSYFLGRNWDWLAARFAIGANFSNFSNTQSKKNQWLSAIIGQIEFPRITVPKQKMFKTFSFYVEGQCWFIPTDVESEVTIKSVETQISGGLRINLF